MYLRQRLRHVDIGDVGKLAHQAVVKPLHLRGLERAHEGGGHVGQTGHRVNHVEIRPHRAPIDLAHRGDFGLHLYAANVKLERVAELQAQGGGHILLHTHRAGLVLDPLAAGNFIARRALDAGGQVELAVQQAARAVVGQTGRRHGFAVDLNQPAADHRVPVEFFHAGFVERLEEAVGLIRHDIDDETVRRIGRRGLAPAVDEVGAQQNQQHQRQQAHRQCADLHHGVGGAG